GAGEREDVTDAAGGGAEEARCRHRGLGERQAAVVGEQLGHVVDLAHDGRERRADERRRRLVHEGQKPRPQDGGRHRVEPTTRARAACARSGLPRCLAGNYTHRRRRRPAGCASVTTAFPTASITRSAPGGTTSVDSRSSTITGPRRLAPAPSRARSYTGVSLNPSKYTGRRPVCATRTEPRRGLGSRTTRGAGPRARTRHETTSSG